MSDHVQFGMCSSVVFNSAAHFYYAGSDHEYGDAGGHFLLSITVPVVPVDRGQQEMDEICGVVLFHYGSFYPFQRYAKAWGDRVDAASDAELSLLFQKSDTAYAGRIPDSVFIFYLYWNVFWRMGSDLVGCGILFGSKSGNTAESL